MITEEQKQTIKEIAATKPIQYGFKPDTSRLKEDCVSYADNVYPEWSIDEMIYFYQMVKSYTVIENVN